jgi:hypothetical protein
MKLRAPEPGRSSGHHTKHACAFINRSRRVASLNFFQLKL